MTPLPGALGGAWELVAWRLDQAKYAASWDSGEGAFLAGGRWNSKGVRAVYASFDPATAILEVAVHKGFKALDAVPHVLTAIDVDPAAVFVVHPKDVPDPAWLQPGMISPEQQAYGDALLAAHRFVAIPSVVSSAIWNVICVAARAAGFYTVRSQTPFVLDPRLHAASAP
jgi:RES domain-containing protein